MFFAILFNGDMARFAVTLSVVVRYLLVGDLIYTANEVQRVC
jgi:hypothetical protein